jgi:hypothetical protein
MEPRPCERKCAQCGEWKHHSRFHGRIRYLPNSTVGEIEFDKDCRDCQQKERNERKNAEGASPISGRQTDELSLTTGGIGYLKYHNI